MIYNRLVGLWGNEFALSDDFPPKWNEWRDSLGKFQLDGAPWLNYWAPAVAHCQNRGWEGPGALASISIEFALGGNPDDSAIKSLSLL